MTLAEARKKFREEIAGSIPKNDIPKMKAAFNQWVNSQRIAGDITESQARSWIR